MKFLDIIGILGLGTFLGSVITIIVQDFLYSKRLKTERQSSLQKEIYFKLQTEAEGIINQIDFLYRQVEEFSFWLKNRRFDINISNKSIEEKMTNKNLY